MLDCNVAGVCRYVMFSCRVLQFYDPGVTARSVSPVVSPCPPYGVDGVDVVDGALRLRRGGNFG